MAITYCPFAHCAGQFDNKAAFAAHRAFHDEELARKRAAASAASTNAGDEEAEDDEVDVYGVLGISDDDHTETVRKIYRKLILKAHPDRSNDREMYDLVQRAWEIYQDPERLMRYRRRTKHCDAAPKAALPALGDDWAAARLSDQMDKWAASAMQDGLGGDSFSDVMAREARRWLEILKEEHPPPPPAPLPPWEAPGDPDLDPDDAGLDYLVGAARCAGFGPILEEVDIDAAKMSSAVDIVAPAGLLPALTAIFDSSRQAVDPLEDITVGSLPAPSPLLLEVSEWLAGARQPIRQVPQIRNKAQVRAAPEWVPDSVGKCALCGVALGPRWKFWTVAPHHCRICGSLVCDDCSQHTVHPRTVLLPRYELEVRSCDQCYPLEAAEAAREGAWKITQLSEVDGFLTEHRTALSPEDLIEEAAGILHRGNASVGFALMDASGCPIEKLAQHLSAAKLSHTACFVAHLRTLTAGRRIQWLTWACSSVAAHPALALAVLSSAGATPADYYSAASAAAGDQAVFADVVVAAKRAGVDTWTLLDAAPSPECRFVVVLASLDDSSPQRFVQISTAFPSLDHWWAVGAAHGFTAQQLLSSALQQNPFPVTLVSYLGRRLAVAGNKEDCLRTLLAYGPAAAPAIATVATELNAEVVYGQSKANNPWMEFSDLLIEASAHHSAASLLTAMLRKRRFVAVAAVLSLLESPPLLHGLLDKVGARSSLRKPLLVISAALGCLTHTEELCTLLSTSSAVLLAAIAASLPSPVAHSDTWTLLGEQLLRTEEPPRLALAAASRSGSDLLCKKAKRAVQAGYAAQRVAIELEWSKLHSRSTPEERYGAVLVAAKTQHVSALEACEASLPGDRWQRQGTDAVVEALAMGALAMLNGDLVLALRCCGAIPRMDPSPDAVRAAATLLADDGVLDASHQCLLGMLSALSHGKPSDSPALIAGVFSHSRDEAANEPVLQTMFVLGEEQQAHARIEQTLRQEQREGKICAREAGLAMVGLGDAISSAGGTAGCLLTAMDFFASNIPTGDPGVERAHFMAAATLGVQACALAAYGPPPFYLDIARRVAASVFVAAHRASHFTTTHGSSTRSLAQAIAQALALSIQAAMGTAGTWLLAGPLATDAPFAIHLDAELHSELLRLIVGSRSMAVAHGMYLATVRGWFHDPDDVSHLVVPSPPALDKDGDETSVDAAVEAADRAEVLLWRASEEGAGNAGQPARALRTVHLALEAILTVPLSSVKNGNGAAGARAALKRLRRQAHEAAWPLCLRLRAWSLLAAHASALLEAGGDKPTANMLSAIALLWLTDSRSQAQRLVNSSAGPQSVKQLLITALAEHSQCSSLSALRREAFDSWEAISKEAILRSTGKEWASVEAVMHWPAILRDEQGFRIAPARRTTSMPGMTLGAVHGATINLESGSVHLNVARSGERLLHEGDLAEIFSSGCLEAHFTLDPCVSPELYPLHPFHVARVLPARLGGDVLATVLHADWLLKFLSIGVELSASAPFQQRVAGETLLAGLPPALRHAVRPVGSRSGFEGHSDGRAVHRFWIAAGTLEHTLDEDSNGSIRIQFGTLRMKVLTQRMILEDGKLKDDKISGGDTAEEEFAADVTAHFDELASFFPCLGRLRELAKVMAVLKIVHGMVESLRENINDHSLELKVRSATKEAVEGLIAQIPSEYPFYSSSAVRSAVDASIRAAGASRYQVEASTLQRLENDAAKILRQNDEHIASQLADAVRQIADCSSHHAREYVQHMLRSRTVPIALLNEVVQAVQAKRRSQFDRCTQGLYRSTGYRRETVASVMKGGMAEAHGGDAWVPAAHYSPQGGVRSVYGGVTLAAQLRAARSLMRPPPTSSYRLSTATLSAQRAVGAPYSDAVRLDNMRNAQMRTAYNMRFFNKPPAQAGARHGGGGGGGGSGGGGGGGSGWPARNPISSFWARQGNGFGGEAYFRNGLFGGNRIINKTELNRMAPAHRNVANTFAGDNSRKGSEPTAKIHLAKQAQTVYRAYGGAAGKQGPWWTTETYSNSAAMRERSAILRSWNSGTHTATSTVPAGAQVVSGRAAPQGDFNTGERYEGGGHQYFFPAGTYANAYTNDKAK